MGVEIHESKDFNKFKNEMRRVIRTVPKMVGITAVHLFVENFTKQGFDTGGGVNMWQKRKDEDAGRAILIGKGTGALRRSIRVLNTTQNSVVIAAGNNSDIKYAQVHNEGGKVEANATVKQHIRKVATRDTFERFKNGKNKKTKKLSTGIAFVKAHTRRISFTMPQRQYMGNSPLLDRTIRNNIIQAIKKAYENS
jgi:phage gpG-like protein